MDIQVEVQLTTGTVFLDKEQVGLCHDSNLETNNKGAAAAFDHAATFNLDTASLLTTHSFCLPKCLDSKGLTGRVITCRKKDFTKGSLADDLAKHELSDSRVRGSHSTGRELGLLLCRAGAGAICGLTGCLRATVWVTVVVTLRRGTSGAGKIAGRSEFEGWVSLLGSTGSECVHEVVRVFRVRVVLVFTIFLVRGKIGIRANGVSAGSTA
mmetsp:Transcript_11092/g.21653  ORF Transcript_11092/g.21653 Transcript_11092/m.21653 type:complete len:211 (-) Transcript_11092:1633-2265(-)